MFNVYGGPVKLAGVGIAVGSLILVGSASGAYAHAVGPVGASADAAISADVESRSTSWSPANPPADLTGLLNKLSDSVVTLFCGRTPATAWAVAGIRLNPEAQAQGHRTMLVTSYTAMRNCLSAESRYVEMRHRGVETLAYVWGWDMGTDVASVHTNLVIPGLQWSEVPRPIPGQWVAAVGSSNGAGVSTTMGVVTSVGLRDLTTSVAVGQPGAGAPLVDSAGRVLATMASESVSVENRAVGSPLLCVGLINCNRPLDVWMNFTVPSGVASLRATPMKGSLRISWARPRPTTTSPVEYYEFRVGNALWQSTTQLSVVIPGLAKGRPVTVEVRAVNFMGPGASSRVTSRPR